jgi:hypothetical protein
MNELALRSTSATIRDRFEMLTPTLAEFDAQLAK